MHKEHESQPHLFVVVWSCVHISYYHSGERERHPYHSPSWSVTMNQMGHTWLHVEIESYGRMFSARDEQICPQAGICVCVCVFSLSAQPDQSAVGVFQVAIVFIYSTEWLLHTFSFSLVSLSPSSKSFCWFLCVCVYDSHAKESFNTMRPFSARMHIKYSACESLEWRESYITEIRR